MEKEKVHKPTLILNTDGMPLKSIGWKRAICLSFIGKEIPGEGITVIKFYDDFVLSARGEKVPVPCVAMTNRYINIKRKVPLTKRNLYSRDNATCQYCGCHLDFNEATIDHVVPKCTFRSKSAATTWNNVVIACRKCNLKKENRTPAQAKMVLLSHPYEPSPYNFRSFKILPEWEEYFQV